MVKQKITKRALLLSALAIIVSITMLVGSTFAWFTDSVTSSGNKIVAGNLEVKLLMHNGTNYVDISDSTSPIFGSGSIANANNAATLWEPGKTQVAYLAIENAGSLDLRYTVGLDVRNVKNDLYEVMKYAVIADAAPGSVNTWTAGESVVVGTQSVSGDVALAAGNTHYFALAIHMDEDAGNEYQGGEVDFDLTVLATQLASELDSFGNDYDVDAEYDIVAGGSTPIVDGQDTVVPVTDLESGDKIAELTVPAGAKLTDDADSIDAKIVENVTNPNVTINTDQGAVTYEITVDGLAADNTVPVEVELFIGKNLTGVELYHYTNSVVAAYSSATGYLYFETATFSPFTVVYDKRVFATVEAEVSKAVEDGIKNIVLESDILLTETLVINGELTLNLNGNVIVGDWHKNKGHVIANYGTLTIMNGTVTSAGNNGGSPLYNAADANMTIKELTINGAQFVAPEWPSYGINNMGNLTIDSADINTYHGGVATGGNGVTLINDADIDVGQGTETDQTSWAIYAYENAEVTVNGGTFANTKNEYGQVYGGGYICSSTNKSVSIYGGTFNKTEADNNGTGLYYNNKNLKIYGGTFDTDPSKELADGHVVIAHDGLYDVAPATDSVTYEYVASGLYKDSAAANYYISNANGLVAYADGINSKTIGASNVALLCDIDMTGVAYAPISGWGTLKTFDGKDYTIRGLYVKSDEAALIATTIGTVKNLTVADSVFEGTKHAAAFVATGYASIQKCTAKNCVMTSGYSGAFGGYSAGGINTGNTAIGCEIYGTYTAGGIFGLVTADGSNTISNNTISDSTVESKYKPEYHEYCGSGEIIGASASDKVVLENNTATNVTVK